MKDLGNKQVLDVQTKIIINNRGTIDKYMGDCIMDFGYVIVKIMLINGQISIRSIRSNKRIK